MWPSRHGLGVQLSYGLQGANIYSESLEASKPWKFARERDGGLPLTKIHNSTQRLVPPQISNVEISTNKDSVIDRALRDVPVSLIDQIKSDENILSSKYVYDPSYGRLIDEGVLKYYVKYEYADVIAYASDASGCTLNVNVLAKKREIAQDGDDRDYELDIPAFDIGSSLSFDSPIRQIEICKSSPSKKDDHKRILVRTTSSIIIVEVRLAKASVTLSATYELTSEEFFGKEFAHFTTSPFTPAQFAVVDVSGNCAVFSHVRGQKTVVKFTARIFEADDFSNFKRISWLSNSSELLVMSRSYVKLLNQNTQEKTDIIAARQWSALRDYGRCWSDDNHGFLLTSKELIWVDVKAGFKRLLSWKHYLDAEDPSLRMEIKVVESITFVALYSQVHPLVFIFQFKFEDGLPKSIRDPVLIKCDTTTSAIDLLLLPVTTQDTEDPELSEEKSIALFKMSTQLEITRLIISTLNGGKMLKYSDERRNSIHKKAVASGKSVAPVLLNNRRKVQVRELAAQVFKTTDNDLEFEEEDATVFQNYALSLGIDKDANRPPSSLLGLADPIENFKDFEEFDNMIEQLEEFCESKGLSFIPLNSLSSIAYGRAFSKIEQIYLYLFNLWNKDSSSSDANKFFSKHITKELALSLSIIYDEEREERILSEKTAKLPKNLLQIVDKWNDDFTIADEDDIPSQLLELSEPAIEPIVTVSQSQQRTTTPASQGLLRPSQRPASQSTTRQSQVTRSSQHLPSQSQPKKKKKRIKGFG